MAERPKVELEPLSAGIRWLSVYLFRRIQQSQCGDGVGFDRDLHRWPCIGQLALILFHEVRHPHLAKGERWQAHRRRRLSACRLQ